MKTFRPLFRLKKYFIRYKRDIFWGIILVIFSNVLYSILPKILQYTIDQMENGIPIEKIVLFAALFVTVTVIHSGLRFFMRQKLIGMARKIEYQLRNDYFHHLQQMSLNFFTKHRTGDLMALATNDIPSVSMTIGRGLMFLLSNIIVFIVVLTLMMRTNLALTLISLIPFSLAFLVVLKSMKFFIRTFERIQSQFADLSSKAQENISGVRVIKAYVQEENEIESFRQLNRKYLHENLKLALARGVVWSSMDVLFGLSFVILIWLGGLAVIRDQITLGEFVAFTVWLGMLSWPVISFGWIINLVQRASASMTRINRVMDIEPEIQDTESCDQSICHISGHIQFINVAVAYEDLMVLENISFEIAIGKTLAIIGPTGSGKTSLIRLIPRLIDAKAGQILIDGHDIRSIPLQVLRRHIGFVPQETFLFSETIAENISFGENDAKFEEIGRVARLSTIHEDLLTFPDQYQTLIGERGVNLSGGQKQRAAISRALLRQPNILILDDALSAVDTYTEEKILNSLRVQNPNQTKIIISHRISSVKHADLILFLKNGAVVERGNHRTLMAEKGLYAELYQQQRLEQALDEL
ncbi:MAG TPA: ABC transporter ATP-binding protein [bacterium]|nr:ABC transporter ATP-binding protein [bacterium]